MSTAKNDRKEILKWEKKIEENRKIIDTPNLTTIDYFAAQTKIVIASNFLSGKRVDMAEKIGRKL